MLNIAYEYGKFGTTSKNLIQENYSRLTFNLVLYDFWFNQRKFE